MLLQAQTMAVTSPKLSLRAYLLLLVLGAQLPPLALAVGVLFFHHEVPVPLWVVAAVEGSLLLGAVALSVAFERRTVAFMSSVTVAADAVARGRTPRIAKSSIRELDDLARSLEEAGAARREAEERLRSGEARLAAILGSATDAIIAVDESCRILLFNRAAEEMFRCVSANVLGQPIDRFVAQDFRRLLEVAPGHDDAFTEIRRPEPLTAFRSNGDPFPVEATVSHVTAGGQTICTMIVRDVTERRRAEEERAALLDREQTARAEAEVAARISSFFAEASRILTASLDYESSLHAVARLAAGILADWCVIDLVAEDGGLRRLAVVHADAGREEFARALQTRYPPGEDGPYTLRRVLANGQAELVAELSEEQVQERARNADHLRLLRGLGLRSMIVAPMLARGRTVGAITLVRATGPLYTGDDRAAVEELAQRAAMAVDNARLYRQAQHAHERFARLVEGLDAIVWEANAVTLELTFVSHRAEALLGYPVSRWLEQPDFWKAIIHPADRDAALEEFHRCARELADCRVEYRALGADGRVVWLANVVRMVREASGDVSRLQGFMLDITERKRIEEERDRLLRREQDAREEAEATARRSKFVAEASQALASSLDYEATLDAVTRLAVPDFADWCFVRLAGDDETHQRLQAAHAKAGETDVADLLERLAPALEISSLAPIINLLEGGQPLLLPEISPAWLETARLLQELAPRSAMIVPLVARGRTLGTLAFIWSQPGRQYGPADLALAEDLAQRAAIAVDNAGLYRQAERANRAKDDFVATLSHELRTPMQAMLGWTMLLKSGRLDSAHMTDAIDHIERNTRLQAELINELLDVSRIVAGKMHIERQPVELSPVIEHSVEAVRRDADAKRLTLRSRIEAGASVLGDAVRLEQILVNLLGNAVKFTPEGGRITVTLDRHQGSARIVVTDTGQGIDARALPHIFERFQQGDSPSTRKHGGLGLGLAIVRYLVSLHGGTVHARSGGPGKGSTFTVYLPVVASAGPGEPAALPPAPLARLDRVRALVVDDDEASRQLVKTVLTQCGAEVVTAASVEDALAVLRGAYVDVLVSDIGMPDADGYELVRRLREMEQGHGGRIPAVALTAFAANEDRERALAAGFDWHITKPITPADLAEVVAKALTRTTPC
jgi:PAS domain S-box-containing protein